ncbi:hypothetical protein CJ030_MR1G016839 [Morella rubra]|uniref:Uncharacterized protein n=1 Tax=Morella rubra TaxID=262757 RepID=A0A6A1WRQ3_9ROSI|nr:hypothetical protein CJ030_MR1G016839 [Morella rubra]
MAIKKRADLCPSEADALSLSMAMRVIPSSRRETRFRLPSANETPYTDGVKGEMCFFEAPLKSGEFLWFYTPIRSTQVDRFWYFRPRNQGVSPITSYPDTNKGWHDRYFFMSGVGWERFPGEDRQSESSLCWAFGSVPDQYRRDIKGLTSSEQAHVDAILEVGSIDWNALVCRENEGWLGYTMSEPSPRANPSPRSERSPHGRFPREDSRKESSRVSVGGTKRKNSQEVEGSSHGHSSKKRRASPPYGVSEAEEEEVEEAPLARMSSKRARVSVSVLHPKSLIHLFISRDFVVVWLLVGLEDVSPMLSPTSGVRTEIPVPAVKVIREIETPSFSISLTVPPDQDLPEAAGGVEVHFDTIPSSGVLPSITPLVMEAPLEELCTAGAVVIGDSGRGKEPVTRPSSSGDDEESDSEPSALPSWRSRPYAQPLLNEEMMEDALRAPRHAKIDRLTRSLSHCVSLVAALDAAELKHDEELESSRLKLRKLEGDLESQRKWWRSCGPWDSSSDANGRLDFELSLSREKAELLQRLSDSRASSSKREGGTSDRTGGPSPRYA